MSLTPEKQRRSALWVIKRAQESKFWGKIILEMKDGNLIQICPHQILKPDKVLEQAEQCLDVNEK